ncbi:MULTISPECIES: hypothetical protein [Cyclobacterium]|nr:hypothetical protein [Cyclobacterium amurskyense]|tara:strand:- start:37361 stop:38284 length:924 start_codon:yes stop_codon:yes gene_type:complete
MMKGSIIRLAILFFICTNGYGQEPEWVVEENNFEYTMSFVSFLNIDGLNLNSTSDKVGAFVNGECRGTTNLIYVKSKDRYYAYFNVFSNTLGETIHFKVYDSEKNQVTDISETVKFETNALRGNLSQAFSIASPALNNEAQLLDFSFKDIEVVNKTENDQEMVLYLNNGVNPTLLKGVFELSDGSKLFHRGQQLISGTSVLDFSSPVYLDVLSQDESMKKQWVISVRYTTRSSSIKIYKKDAVCYNGGAIKVVSDLNGGEIILFKDQIEYAKLPIVNGEVLFTDLLAGDYLLKTGDLEKNVEIILKE